MGGTAGSFDDFENALVALAAASVPDVFEPAESPVDEVLPRFHAVLGPIANDPSLLGECVEALGSDQQLSSLAERPAFVQTSLGSGWRVELEELALGLVTSAVARVVLSGAKPDADLLTDATARALADFRQLWAGATVTVPSVTGFSGFELLDDVVVSTPWGSLRSASELERHFRSPIGRASAVISTPTRVSFVGLGDPPKPMSEISDQDEYDRVGRVGGLFVLAFLLSGGEGLRPVADAAWQSTLVPGYPGIGFVSRLATSAVPWQRPIQHVDAEWAAEIERWATLVHEFWHPSIEVATTRTVAAVRERASHQDALIDAVIAWENLFGGEDQGEVTFRVTAAISRLLEVDPGRRMEMQKRLKQVYNTRSRIVHGALLREKDRLRERCDVSIDVALRCLRELLEHRPELIHDRGRGQVLLLE